MATFFGSPAGPPSANCTNPQVPILMKHGRNGYRRVATFLCYYFYKNICLCFGEIVWTLMNGFSGQSMFPDWYSKFFLQFYFRDRRLYNSG